MNRFDDDFFSPVRCDSSIVDFSYISDGSTSEVSNCDTRLSFPNTASVVTPEGVEPQKQKQDIKFADQDELLECNDSVFICTPVSNKNLSSTLNRKIHSSNFEKMKLDKTVNLQDTNTLEKENPSKNSEPIQKQKSETKGNKVENNNLKLNPKQNDLNKRLTRPTSLSPNSVSVDPTEVKQVKVEKKKSNKSSKKTSSEDFKKSGSNCSINKKLMVDPLDLKKQVPLKNTSEKCSDTQTVLDSLVLETSSAPQDTVKLETASCFPPSHYEESIEKIVHDCISMECDKIRQNLYLQQMSFYRQINKIKQEMEQQHKNTTDGLLKVVEKLMEMNATLKSLKNK